jgi:RluA family pseudouridine synthase
MNEWRIIHRDDRILAVDKPAGLLVIPGRGPERGPALVDLLADHLGSRPLIVHRIDRETSGLVLFALDAATHRTLSLAFERRRVRKSYLALVQGEMSGGGSIDMPLREFGSGRVAVDDRGKASRTEYEVVSRFQDSTLLEVHPVTGRRHQIRVHLYALGHPVLGDTRYGDPRPVGGAARLMLHAWKLELLQDAGLALPPLVVPPPPDFPHPVISSTAVPPRR